ncbi:cation:proton antiporter [Candidatus Peregrinibacteria bacterium]|nr:cation:proton antiporter [Candidatus Peregrinibacteria bacterium]
MPDFMNLLILMVMVWTAGKIFRSLKLPVVLGQLMGGILVGPALLGLVDPNSETIKVLAELGIFFLMLHAGLETDHREILKASRRSFLIALGGTVLSFTGGYYMARLFGQPQITSLFIGMGLSVSAIAMAARVFKDCGIMNTRTANVTLGAAIFENIFALILFSVIISVTEQGVVELIPLLILLLKVCVFFTVVIFAGLRLSKFMNRILYFGNKGFTLTLIIALLMGLIAEAIGLHMIIGAFLAGLFIHEEVIDKRVFDKIEDRIYGLSYGFFGPIFFASLAFHLDFSAFTKTTGFLAALVGVAILGKVIGSGIVAKFEKLTSLESLIIGISMNNRGAVELVIATIGLQTGIISETVFSILVAMAFITTIFSILATPPLAKKLKQAN